MIEIFYDFHCFFYGVNDVEDLEVAFAYHSFFKQRVQEPVVERFPEFFSNHDDREGDELVGLYQGDCFW